MHNTSNHVIKCEIVLPEPKLKALQRTSVKSGKAELTSSRDPASEVGTLTPDPETIQEELRYRCWLGSQNVVNMMMPDRPYDIQFAHFNALELDANQAPKDLQNYLSDLEQYLSIGNAELTQPNPPLTISQDDQTYVLHTNTSVRQRAEAVHTTSTTNVVPLTAAAIVEDVLDLETDHNSVTCQVVCDQPYSEGAWKAFLTVCDHLTTINSPRQVNDSAQESDTYIDI